MTRKTPFRTALRLLAAGMLFALSVVSAGLASADDGVSRIPWKPGATLTRVSVEDDVRGVLRAILSADNLSVLFRPGVDGKISFQFNAMPLKAAFEQVMQESALHASFNPATRTVTIGPGAPAAEARRFITLRNVDWASLRQILVSFGIGTDDVTFDPSTSVLALGGDPTRMAQVEDLVKTLEQHHEDQRDQALAQTAQAASAQRSDLERRMYADAMNVETRVFRLRFADVGPTTRNFHGRTITIPGVLDTLNAMLGNEGTAPPPYTTQTQTGALFRPSLPARSLPAGQLAGRGPGADQMPAAAPAYPMPPGLGKPNISIDQRTNSVIVRGSPAAIAAVEDVLRRIDQPVKMVDIEVIIATAAVGVVNQLGVTYRGTAANGHVAFDTGASGGLVGSASNLNALTLLPASAAGATAASFVLNGNNGLNVQAQIQALSEHNKARVLSAPNIVTLDNVTARITRSADIYVPVDTGGFNGQGLSEIQTGLTLEITPSIVPPARGSSGQQLIRLTLDATDSAPSSGTGNQINVSSQEVQTDVLVPDGGTYVIGGLFDDTRLKSRSGVPVLKDIPLLGQLFRSDSSQQNLGQTVFFITPRIIENDELVNREVALGNNIGRDTAAYIDGQRRRLSDLGQEMNGTARRSARTLEEDE